MTGYILCALLVTVGLFLLTGTKARDVTDRLRMPFERDISQKKRIRQITGKKPSTAQRMMEEAVTMLDASGMGEQVATYRNMAILLAAAGFLFGMVIDNILVSLVLSIGLAMTPLTIIRMRTADYGRMVSEKLEMAMGSVTNSYVATGNLLTAVERVLPMLPAPVSDIFKRFIADMQYVDGNTVRAIQHMREAVDNWYWQEWCNALIQCQDDVSLNRTLSGIVERLSEMRQIQMEVDTTLRKHMSDYVVTVMLVLGSIPLMGFMIPDWYDMLMNTLPGKITLAIVLATVLVTSVWVSRAHLPAEGVEQE
ncbi:MAG: hypothetical protein RSD95_00740 [Clostridia bacterium]